MKEATFGDARTAVDDLWAEVATALEGSEGRDGSVATKTQASVVGHSLAPLAVRWEVGEGGDEAARPAGGSDTVTYTASGRAGPGGNDAVTYSASASAGPRG